MRMDFSTFFSSLRSRSRVRSSSVYSSSSVARSDGVGGDLVLAQVLAGIVGVAQDLVADVEQALLEEGELRLVHVILLGRLEDLLLRQLARLRRLLLDGGSGLRCHASFHPSSSVRCLPQ
jgi:hypothetical protein